MENPASCLRFGKLVSERETCRAEEERGHLRERGGQQWLMESAPSALQPGGCERGSRGPPSPLLERGPLLFLPGAPFVTSSLGMVLWQLGSWGSEGDGGRYP